MSKSKPLPVAVIQPIVKIADVDANIASHLEMINKAGKLGARLVVSSEAGLTGYDRRFQGVKAAINHTDPRLNLFAKAAKKHGLCAIVGFFGHLDGKLYNSSVAFLPDGTRVIQHKNILTQDEKTAGITTGPALRTPVLFAGRKIAIVICADVSIPRLWATLEKQGFDTVALCTAGLGDSKHAVPPSDLKSKAKAQKYVEKAGTVGYPTEMLGTAITHKLDMIISNQAGFEPRKHFFHVGHGSILSANGRIHGVIPGQYIGELLQAEMLTATL